MVQRMFFHAVAVAALGAMCVAQSNAGSSGSIGQGQQQSGSYQSGTYSSGSMRQQQGAANAPSSMSTNTATAGSASAKSPDQAFIKKAAQGNLAEVELGNLAQQNGENSSVKQFGERMATDHSQANTELQQIARDKGVTVPSSPSAKDQQEKKLLQSKRGATFDNSYARAMVRDHEADIAEFRKEAETGKDPQVKAFAQKTLPILEQHLSMAKQMHSQVVSESAKPGAMSAPQTQPQGQPQSPSQAPSKKY